MADPKRLLAESQGKLASSEALWDNAVYWMAELLNGHPRAQDFEPTGHGGSDPTSQNGTRPDSAAADGKRTRRLAERIWRDTDELLLTLRRYQPAIRPERKPEDLEELWCVIHLQLGYPEPRAHLDLCSPCYKYKSNHNGQYPTVEDVHYYITHYGQWPKRRVDPKQHSGPLTAEQAAERINKGQAIATTEALKLGEIA